MFHAWNATIFNVTFVDETKSDLKLGRIMAYTGGYQNGNYAVQPMTQMGHITQQTKLGYNYNGMNGSENDCGSPYNNTDYNNNDYNV